MGITRFGFPLMHKEQGERRVFLPEFMAFLARIGVGDIVLESGYGSSIGLTDADYTRAAPVVRFGSVEECYGQDGVAVLRCPDEKYLRIMKRGALLVSMLHYPTRPGRVSLLRELGLKTISMDSIKDDLGRRLVENLSSVGWNGVGAGFQALRHSYRRFAEPVRRPVRVTIMGCGAVGIHAAQAATRYGDNALRQEMADRRVPGVEVTVIDYDLTCHENYMLSRLEMTDMLVDATQRPDESRAVVPNDWVAALPSHAVMVDLSVDPYDFTRDPPAIKGIEGIPEGNLDQYVFQVDDAIYGRMDPRIHTTHRRISASCYSWPGVQPRECMDVYGKQLEPVFRVAVERGVDNLQLVGGFYYERAVARSLLINN